MTAEEAGAETEPGVDEPGDGAASADESNVEVASADESSIEAVSADEANVEAEETPAEMETEKS